MNLHIDIVINTEHLDIDAQVYDGEPFSTPIYRRFDNPKDALQAWNFVEDKRQAISIKIPHIIILDLRSYGRIGLRFLATIRQRFPSVKIPVLLLMDLRQPLEFRRSVFLQRECYSVTIDENSTIQSIKDEIREQLQTIQEVRYPHPLHLRHEETAQIEQSTSHAMWKTRSFTPNQIVNLHHLELLCWIWRERQNVHIQFQKYNWLPDQLVPQLGEVKDILLLNGGFTQIEDEYLIHEMLGNYGSLHVKRVNQNGLGDWITHGEILFEENKKQVEPGFLRERQQLQLHKIVDLWEDLPIQSQTEATLHETDEKSTMQLLSERNIRAMDIEEDIETLYQMGLISFRILESNVEESDGILNDEFEFREEPEFHIADKIDEMLQHVDNPWELYQITVDDNMTQSQNKMDKTIELWESRYACLTLPRNREKWHQLIQALEQNKYYILMYSEIQQHFVEGVSRTSSKTQSNVLPTNIKQKNQAESIIKQEVVFRKGLVDFCQRAYLSALTNFTLAVREHSSVRNMVFVLWSQIRLISQDNNHYLKEHMELQRIRESVEIFMFENDHNAILKYIYVEILLYQDLIEDIEKVMNALKTIVGGSYIVQELERIIATKEKIKV